MTAKQNEAYELFYRTRLGDKDAMRTLEAKYGVVHVMMRDSGKSDDTYVVDLDDLIWRAYLAYAFLYNRLVPNGRNVAESLFSEMFPDLKLAVEEQRDSFHAQFMLGVCYHEGFGSDKDYKRALELYKGVSDKGLAAAQCRLGYCYDTGQGVAIDYKEAIRLYELAAESYTTAMCNLAICYDCGNGVEVNMAKAIELYTRAAASGYPDALFSLGECYRCGESVPQDFEKAAALFRRAMEHGCSSAMYSLGECYYLGEGVEQDVMEALRLYKEAAALDEADAFNALGDCYRRGIVTPDEEYMSDEDLLKASFNMYEQASSKGCLIAKCNLADAYRFGEGVEINLEKSFSLYSEVAAKNHDEGQYLLAEAYEVGIGVAVDVVQAMRYYRKAAAQGYSKAEEKIQNLRHTYREAYEFIYRPVSPPPLATLAGVTNELAQVKEAQELLVKARCMRPDPNVIHTVFYTEDMYRLIVQFL